MLLNNFNVIFASLVFFVANVIAVGLLFNTSAAKDGPLKIAIFDLGKKLFRILLKSSFLFKSIPLEQITNLSSL